MDDRKYTKTENAFWLLNRLSRGLVVSTEEVARERNIHTRSVPRLIETLRDEVGFDIVRVKGGYKLLKDPSIPNANLSVEDVEHIVKSLKDILNLNQNIYTHNHRASLYKLMRALDVRYKNIKEIDTVETRKLIIDNPVAYSNNFESLENAVSAREFVRINYNTFKGENKNYRIQAYELFIVNQIWYLGGVNENGEIRYFKGTRIYSVDRTQDKFHYDETIAQQIKVDNYGFKIDVEEVVVKVRGNNFFKEYEWGSKQRITEYEDGSYDMKVQFKNRLAAESFILSGGAHFEVLEPKHLREWIQDEIEKIKQNYA